jgi:hypothetical protein
MYMRFFAEPVLSAVRFFAALRMTKGGGLGMAGSGRLRMTSDVKASPLH